jgi:hypothetical protein
MIFRKKDPDERSGYDMHIGDYGVVIIAAILTLGAFYLLLSPENFGAEFTKAAKTIDSVPQAQRQPGETPAMIFNEKKK